MKRLLILLLLIVSIFGQTWKGGNTADYDANSVCSDVYLLHRGGTTFPEDTRAECCADTVISGDWTYVDGDSFWIPIPPDWYFDSLCCQCTTACVCSTITIDSTITLIVYAGEGGVYFTSFNSYVCESLLIAIDTVETPDDSFYCVFCDSILNVAWWQYSCEDSICDTLQFDSWRVSYPSFDDSCDVINTATIHTSGHFDTTGILYIDSIAVYDTIGSCCDSTLVDNRIEQWFENNNIGRPGVWVKNCTCDVADTLPILADSLDAMFCISTDWQATATIGGEYRDRFSPLSIERTYCDNASQAYLSAYHSVNRAEMTGTASNATISFLPAHLVYMQDYVDTVRALFNDNDEVFILGSTDSTINPRQVFYEDYDTTQEFIAMIGDTARTEGCIWDGGVFTGASPRSAYKFTNEIDFRDMYSDAEIATMQATQPRWLIVPASDDIIPFVKINGTYYQTASPVVDNYEVVLYYIEPEIDYTSPLAIETGVYSCMLPYLGGQVLFALVYEDTIYNSCYEFRDSITLPDCGSSSDCSDSICFHWTQGWNPFGFEGNNFPVTQCFSICELDTVDMTGVDYGVSFSPPYYLMTISPDSTDTFTITHFQDSVVIKMDDPNIPLKIHMDTQLGSNSLKFYDSSQTDTTSLFQVADTFNIATNDTSVIVKIGSGSVFISDKAIWFSGATIPHDVYGVSLGRSTVVSGDYASAFGDGTVASGNYSFVTGGLTNTASGIASFSTGYSNDASGETSFACGTSNTASDDMAFASGFSNISSGLYSFSANTANESAGQSSMAWNNSNYVNGENSTVWNYDNKCYGDFSTASGYKITIDSTADYSFFIGMNDTLTDDSTFCSSYPYNEFRGQIKYKKPVIKIHRIDTFEVADTLWHAMPWDTLISSETTFLGTAWEYPVGGSDSTKIVINEAGIYSVGGCLHFQNNTGGAFTDIGIWLHVLVNGCEARCLQREYSASTFRATLQQSLEYAGTIVVDIGDTIELEIKTNEVTTDFISSSRFTNPVASTIYIEYLSENE